MIASFRNRAVYESSPGLRSGEIRLLRILPGKLHDALYCELSTGNLENSEYEALSYTWGSVYRQKRIQVNRLPFSVGANLYDALLHLRHPDRARTMWIDAVCINQGDARERESQVKQMRQVYQRGSSVVIFLGNSRDQHLGLGIHYIKRLARANETEVNCIWQESSKWQKAIDKLLRAPWWHRAWVIQEAFLARRAVFQYGHHLIGFDELCSFVTNPAIMGRLSGLKGFAVFNLATTVQGMRQAVGDPQYGMLALAHQFRNCVSTDSRDKIYAFMGLLEDENNQLIPVDYRRTTEVIFQEFAKASINRYGTLLVVALAAENPSKASWCTSWSTVTGSFFLAQYWPDILNMMGYESNSPFWRSGLDDKRWYPLQVDKKYRAAGGHEAICMTDLADPAMISVKGFTYDVVAFVGEVPMMQVFTTWWTILEKWETLAFQTSPAPEDEKRRAFDRTITANIPESPIPNWREWAPKTRRPWKLKRATPQAPEEHTIQHIMIAACDRRCFFVTKNGTFGLGSTTTKVGDKVCVLLGSDVPFIVQRVERSNLGRYRNKSIPVELEVLHKVRGQAYLDGAMVYEGDIKQDIVDAKIELEDFFLI
jgi:hypothetical protein